jgi:deoxyribose-phosphate aldolase
MTSRYLLYIDLTHIYDDKNQKNVMSICNEYAEMANGAVIF